jgi:hypothetical protein
VRASRTPSYFFCHPILFVDFIHLEEKAQSSKTKGDRRINRSLVCHSSKATKPTDSNTSCTHCRDFDERNDPRVAIILTKTFAVISVFSSIFFFNMMAAGAAGVAGMTAGTTNNNNNNNKKRVRHNTHYITGLGDGNVNAHAHDLSRSGGGDAAVASPKKGNTRTRQQHQLQNHANNGLVGAVGGAVAGGLQHHHLQLDDVFDDELFRKKMNNQDHPHHHNVRGNFEHGGTGSNKHNVQQAKDFYGRKDSNARGVGWDFSLFSDANAGGAGPDEYNIGGAATPWQMSAFALLGAVILLSALFLHVLADAHSDQQHNYHHQQQQHSSNGHSYRRRRNNASHRSNNHHGRTSPSKVTKRKKTDEWSDDAEDELLNTSLRGYRAGESDDDDVAAAAHSSSSHHQHHHHPHVAHPQAAAAAALYYPYPQQQQPKLQHRKNTTSGGLGVVGVVSNTSGVVSAAANNNAATAALAPGPGATSSTSATAAGAATVNAPAAAVVAPFQHRNYYINPGGAIVATTMSNRASGSTAAATTVTTSSRGGSSGHSSSYQVNNNARTPLALNRPTVTLAGASPAAADSSSSTTLHVPGMMPPPAPLPGMYLTPSLQQQATFAMRRSSPYDGTGTSRHNLNARVLSGVSSFGSLMDPDGGFLDDVEAESKINLLKTENIKTPSKPSVTIQVPPSAAAAPSPQQQARAPPLPRADGMENDCDVLRNHVFQSSPDEVSRETIKLADLVDKTPRARNGRLTIMPGDKPSKDDVDEHTQDASKAAVTAVGAAGTPLMPTKIAAVAAGASTASTAATIPKTPVAQRAMIHQDSTSPAGTPIMPFLPNLDPEHISKPPRSINVDDLHLYMMMESGNVTWCQQQQHGGILPSTSEDSGILATEPTPHHSNKNKNNKKEQPLPSHMAMMLQPSISECCPSSGYDDDASLDDNDPRKNIKHKRDNLTSGTDSAQSLQGEVNFSELQMHEVIGGGGFGQVWRAVWLGTPVAVKVLTGSAQSKNVPRAVLEEFAAEINLLRGMRHPSKFVLHCSIYPSFLWCLERINFFHCSLPLFFQQIFVSTWEHAYGRPIARLLPNLRPTDRCGMLCDYPCALPILVVMAFHHASLGLWSYIAQIQDTVLHPQP